MPRRKAASPPVTSTTSTAVTHSNAVRHGLTAATPVIPGVESLEEWEAFLARMSADRAPVGPFEEQLVERIASLFWRLGRVLRYESESIAVSRERVEYDFAIRRAYGMKAGSIAEAEARTADARRCLAIIERLVDTPPATPLPAADVEALLDEFAVHAVGHSGLGLTAGEDFDAFYADVPAATADGPWTAGRLVEVLRAVAAAYEETFPDLLADVLARAHEVASGRERERLDVLDEIDRMKRERLLPDGPTLERIVRYETAINRMLNQAISQLEAAQARRAGAPLPLARVQLFGLPGG